ncbi:MAG TPA: HPr kinase/phosphatase C-terminal domain-containing protein [Caulobacteraceae bacterium]|jgi:serine kinase of HPr protein (carbohydrate metabolism regulator)
MIVHATCVARRVERDWLAVLLFGESGSGKSDLALRALDAGWRLISDDYTVVWPSAGALWARAPDAIADRLEARGLGLLYAPRLCVAKVALAATCQAEPLERLPEDEVMALEGLELPAVRLHALQTSALAKLHYALATRRLEPGPVRPI